MPLPAKIATLPAEVRQELHLRVIEAGFSGYEGHSAWLKSLGHDISHTAVWRYFKEVRAETQRRLLAVSVSTVEAGLLAALTRQLGEEVTLATEGLLLQARYEKLREDLERGGITLEDLQGYEKLERGQRLTRLRAERELALREARQREAAEKAAPAESREEAARRTPLSAEGEAQIRAKYEGSA